MNPYIIGPYKETDSSMFWGRTTEIDGMYRSFMQNDYLVCYADSGEGKSSIINAGLFPKLRENGYYPINIRFSFDDEIIGLDFDKIINTIINNTIKDVDGVSYKVRSLLSDTVDKTSILWQTNFIEQYETFISGNKLSPISGIIGAGLGSGTRLFYSPLPHLTVSLLSVFYRLFDLSII